MKKRRNASLFYFHLFYFFSFNSLFIKNNSEGYQGFALQPPGGNAETSGVKVNGVAAGR